MMTRADAEWIIEALQKAELRAELIGSLTVKKQSRHDIDVLVHITQDRDYQAYWHALEALGFRYESTEPQPSDEIWIGRGRDGTSLVLDIHPVKESK
jgi:hypothetical protein